MQLKWHFFLTTLYYNSLMFKPIGLKNKIFKDYIC